MNVPRRSVQLLFALVVLSALAVVPDLGTVFGVRTNGYPTVLKDPGVPKLVLASVLVAEAQMNSVERSPTRQTVEAAQGWIAAISPAAACETNCSVGEFGLKPSALGDRFDYVKHKGLLDCDQEMCRDMFQQWLAEGSLDPDRAAVQAAVLLEFYKDQHPVLSAMTWAEIENNQNCIAKLYSAYAGGDQDLALWQSTLEPGEVAKRRLGYDEASGQFERIAQIKFATASLTA